MLTAVLDDTFTHFGDFFSSFMVCWLLNLIETRRVSFWLVSTVSTLQIALELLKIKQSFMPKPVFFMTVQEAHMEYNSLMDKIRAKYEQLDSGKFGSPGTPAFDAEACELANLLAHVSQLCTKLNLPTPKELYRPTFFKH